MGITLVSDLNPAEPLDHFALRFLKSGCPIGFVPLFNAVHKVEDVTAITWLREGQFQVQMFIYPPNYITPEHTHPNVDSYECVIGGQGRFSHSGRWITPEDSVHVPAEGGLSRLRGLLLRVRPNDRHGGYSGPGGGVFFSIQHWLNGVEPHCVGSDYSGMVMGPNHMASVKSGAPVLAADLSRRDAATDEQ